MNAITLRQAGAFVPPHIPGYAEVDPSALASQAPVSIAQPPSSVLGARLLVFSNPPRLEWAIKRGDILVDQGTAAVLAEVRGLEVRSGIFDVTIDGPDTPELRRAAAFYDWKLGPSLAHGATLSEQPAPNGSTPPTRPVTAPAVAAA